MSAADQSLSVLSDLVGFKIPIMCELTTHILTTSIVYFVVTDVCWQVKERSLGRQEECFPLVGQHLSTIFSPSAFCS